MDWEELGDRVWAHRCHGILTNTVSEKLMLVDMPGWERLRTDAFLFLAQDIAWMNLSKQGTHEKHNDVY
jgi:hypothetical protein